MADYRIVQVENNYRIEKRCLFWWKPERYVLSAAVELPLTNVRYYSSLEAARNVLEERRAKRIVEGWRT